MARGRHDCRPLAGEHISGAPHSRGAIVEAEGQPAHIELIDEAAFLHLLEPMLPIALRLAHGMLRNPSEAEDVVQDASLKAWAKLNTFHADRDFKSWYLTIVANECRQTLRSAWWRAIRLPFIERGSSEPPQDQVAVADEVHRALARLSYDHRLAIVLRFYLDMSFEEMGNTLGIPPQTARTRTHRALARLRPIFDVPEVLGND